MKKKRGGSTYHHTNEHDLVGRVSHVDQSSESNPDFWSIVQDTSREWWPIPDMFVFVEKGEEKFVSSDDSNETFSPLFQKSDPSSLVPKFLLL